jgi:hypothetical protein
MNRTILVWIQQHLLVIDFCQARPLHGEEIAMLAPQHFALIGTSGANSAHPHLYGGALPELSLTLE